MEYSPNDPGDTGSDIYVTLNSSLPLRYNDTPYGVVNPNDTATHEPADIPTDTTNLLFLVLKSVAMILVIVTAILGNSLVIISVFKFRNLRIISNFFIMSLAVADLTVALLVMPFNAIQEIVGYWVFRNIIFCDIYNANDVLFSTASLLHLCCISMDRYIAITDPFHYSSRMTKVRVAVMLGCAWGASALISHIPLHTGWYASEEVRNHSSVIEGVCVFDVNMIYAIISSTISFWIPTFIMVFTYIMIFREARKQERRLMELTRLAPPSTRQLKGSPNGRNSAVSSPQRGNSVQAGISYNGSIDTNGYQNNNESEPRRLSKERNKMRREHKAAKTLGIIMGCFLLCWLPFFLWYVITTICGDELCPTPDAVICMLFWIGYFNSALNPMIYAFFNKDFRKAFQTLLRCQKVQALCPCCPQRSQTNNLSYTEMMENRSARPSLIPRSASLVPKTDRSASLVPSSSPRVVQTYDTVSERSDVPTFDRLSEHSDES